MRIGITGHTNLTDATAELVAAELRKILADQPDRLVGVTCLARGADQVFARVVLELDGALEVVLPAADYRERKVEPGNVADFDSLIAVASVRTMPFAESNGDAYMAASEHVLSIVDKVVAVWDGGPSGGHGGTADVVGAARARGLDVTVVWPERAARS
ncbi:hypothetical protein ABZ282_41770 [Amycolatopsis tolypomycina]